MAASRRQFVFGLLLLALVLGVGVTAIFGADEAEPEPAIPALLKAFDRYSVVALGESHWSRPRESFTSPSCGLLDSPIM